MVKSVSKGGLVAHYNLIVVFIFTVICISIFTSTELTMGNTVGTSNTHVANASGRPIRIYYSVQKMQLEEMVIKAGTNIGVTLKEISGSASLGIDLHFKRDSRIRYIRIPVKDFIKISGEGELYASVFVESSECPDRCMENISLNFHIPSDRSFIVTPNNGIRFQKYGASIWEDEYGNRYN